MSGNFPVQLAMHLPASSQLLRCIAAARLSVCCVILQSPRARLVDDILAGILAASSPNTSNFLVTVSNILMKILARMSQGCCEETDHMEFQLYSNDAMPAWVSVYICDCQPVRYRNSCTNWLVLA